MSPIEHLLEQSTIARQVKRELWDPFCVNGDDEKAFQGYIHQTVVSVSAYFIQV